MNRWLKYVTCFGVECCAISVGAQSPFDLDTTFRAEILNNYVGSVLPLEDGKVIASGVMKWPGELYEKRLVRLLSNGERDETFYNSGLGQGKITSWQNNLFYVATSQTVRRILPEGEQDGSFIEMNTGPYFSSLQGGDYHVFPDGRVVMSGYHNLSDSIRGFMGYHNFIWFSNEGYLDTTRVHRTGNGVIYRFKELPDGKFICTGTGTIYDGQETDKLFRVHADGSYDESFQSGVTWSNAYAYHPLPDGRVYVGGKMIRTVAPDDTLRLVRFLSNGEIDTAFDPPEFTLGAIPDQSGLGATVWGIDPFEGGRLIITGQFQYADGQPRRGICMIDSTGALLDVFHDQGVSPYTYQGIVYGTLGGIIPYGDEHYLIWGAYHGYDDGTISDPQQRFVTRLHKGELHVGAEDAVQQGSILQVYPNPTTASVQIDINDAIGTSDRMSIRLKDPIGREIWSQQLIGNRTVVRIEDHVPGIYVVELYSNDRRIGRRKLVIQ